MKKLIKIVTITLTAAVLLIVTGGAILGLFIDPNDYKSEIEQKALETANINLQNKRRHRLVDLPFYRLRHLLY